MTLHLFTVTFNDLIDVRIITMNSMFTRLASRAALLLGRYVRVIEEVEKQNKIAKVHGESELQIAIGHVALVPLLFAQKYRAVDVNTDDHLQNLRRRNENVDPFGNLESQSATPVVGVHYSMHREIHEHEPEARRRPVKTREIHVNEHGRMVIPMQEDKLLLSGHYEQRVEEFGQFAQQKQATPSACDPVLPVGVAEGAFDSLFLHEIHELGHEAECAKNAETGEHEIPGDQRATTHELFAITHVFLQRVDDGDISERVEETNGPRVGHVVLFV